MTNDKLMYAAMLALTQQNVTPKIAPLSTTLMQGICINRNIKMGETVCCYYNDSHELTRVGDVPTHSGDFFVDEDNKMYWVQGNKLHVVDGVTGYVYEESEDAYGFVIYEKTCAAYKTVQGNSPSIWRVIFPDGERSNAITIPDSDETSVEFRFGYRNGVLGLVTYKGTADYSYGLHAYTYTKSGEMIAEMARVRYSRAVANLIIPLNPYEIGCCLSYGFDLLDRTAKCYVVATVNQVSSYYPWDGYDTGGSGGYLENYVGVDQSYIYTISPVYEEVEVSEGVTEHVYEKTLLARFSIDNFNGLEELSEFNNADGSWSWYFPPTTYGSYIQGHTIDGTAARGLYDISTGERLYSEDLPSLPGTSRVYENEWGLWIEEYGVFQKTVLGWLMYATSIYPRTSPWGKLGYAVQNVDIGKNGLAVVLFE